MIVVTIDVGNTLTKVALFKEKIFASASFAVLEAGHLQTFLKSHNIKPTDVKSVILSCVVAEKKERVRDVCVQVFGFQPTHIDSLNNSWGEPTLTLNCCTTMGIDRILACYGALLSHSDNLIVLTAGTALTVNVVTKESGAKFVLQGGSITAGLTKYIDALNFTPELANIIKGQTEDFWLSLPKTAIGKCTLSNLHSGIYFGYVGMVAQLLIQTLTEMRREHNINSATIILTGGASKNLHLNVKAAMLAAMWDDNEPENLDLQKTAKHTPKNAKPAKNAKTKITPKILQNDNLIHNALFKLSQHLQ